MSNPTQRGPAARGQSASLRSGVASQTETSTKMSGKLWKHVGELATSSALLLFLSSRATERLSLTQAAFFLLAATADAAGRPATRTELIGDNMADGKASIRNSYRQLLEPSRVYPTALGWLTSEENPDDAREKVLRLTPEGRRVIDGVLLALEPLVAGVQPPALAS